MNETILVHLGSINFNEVAKSDFLYKLKNKGKLKTDENTFQYECTHYKYLVIRPNKTVAFRNNKYLEYSRVLSFEDFIEEYQ